MKRTVTAAASLGLGLAIAAAGATTAQASQIDGHKKAPHSHVGGHKTPGSVTATRDHLHGTSAIDAGAESGHNHQAPPHKPYQSHPIRHPHPAGTGCSTKCRPAPLPVPAGGWPCAKDHSCATKHHHPICPPTKPPVKPPVTPVPKPPVITVVHHAPKPPVARAVPDAPQLAYTGTQADVLVPTGLGLLGLGGLSFFAGRKPREQAKAMRGAL